MHIISICSSREYSPSIDNSVSVNFEVGDIFRSKIISFFIAISTIPSEWAEVELFFVIKEGHCPARLRKRAGSLFD